LSKLSINNQVQKIYGSTTAGEVKTSTLRSVSPHRFYGKPDIELMLADYIKLPVMTEVFYELLPSVALKKKKTGEEISITWRSGDNQFTTNPALMIDGVIIRDPSLISGLDPEMVEKIDVVRDNYLVGKYVFPGLLNVITKAGDFTGISLPDYMIRFNYRVIEPVATFNSPDYSLTDKKESRMPDYRNTICWNPAIRTSAGKTTTEFWTSDNPGEYLINVEGVTSKGKLISIKKILKVK
jgi:hypothetical protein